MKVLSFVVDKDYRVVFVDENKLVCNFLLKQEPLSSFASRCKVGDTFPFTVDCTDYVWIPTTPPVTEDRIEYRPLVGWNDYRARAAFLFKKANAYKLLMKYINQLRSDFDSIMSSQHEVWEMKYQEATNVTNGWPNTPMIDYYAKLHNVDREIIAKEIQLFYETRKEMLIRTENLKEDYSLRLLNASTHEQIESIISQFFDTYINEAYY